MLFAWQAQGFRHVAKYVAGAGVPEGFMVDLKRVRHDVFRVGGAKISGSVMPMFEASDAESVETLQISCYGKCGAAPTGLRMPRFNAGTFEESI